ncbi:MAG: hypothetical protein D3926_17820 [Desulfobacteraceae bacterium]|nr:MAG: hypothetical protein D3926_17820 [Desulfobacteraceae bacterium]
MLKKDLILRNPAVQILGKDSLFQGRFGAVLSRAGVGKTRFLVQIALVKLLEDEQVLHVSLSDQMEKINVRYNEGFSDLVDSIGYVDPAKASEAWDDISHNKVAISYNESTFDSSKIRDYLNSFTGTDLEIPKALVVDGLNFDTDITNTLTELEEIAQEFNLFIWFSMQIHREEAFCDDGFPIQLENHKDRFDKAILLLPVENKIQATILKDGDKTSQEFLLDPSSVMPV